jgi:hypothetical protein
MEKKWVSVGEYLDRKLMYEVISLLDKSDITTRVETSGNFINSAYGQQNMVPDILFVIEEDATKAKELINEVYGKEKDTIILDDYNLEELADIVKNPNEWHQSFLDAAMIELKKRQK